jgi:hypothetical protein
MTKMYIVCIGSPFENIRFVAGFQTFDEADQWCCDNVSEEFTYIVTAEVI